MYQYILLIERKYDFKLILAPVITVYYNIYYVLLNTILNAMKALYHTLCKPPKYMQL